MRRQPARSLASHAHVTAVEQDRNEGDQTQDGGCEEGPGERVRRRTVELILKGAREVGVRGVVPALADHLADVGHAGLRLRGVNGDEDVACDANLVDRWNSAVEDIRRPGGERLVLLLLQVGGEDGSEREESEYHAGVSRGDRPPTVNG